jgi:hypothetical protein
VVTESNTNKAPKVLKWFHAHYGYRVRRYIKTTPIHAERTLYNDKELLCVPHFMIKTVV